MPSSIFHLPSSVRLAIANRQRVKKLDSRLLKKISAAVLAELKIVDAEIEINLVGKVKMAELNQKFLRHEGSTDVITFNYSNSEFGIRNSELRLRGEIFVCVNEAISQAKQFRTNWQSEIVRYIVHGVLHLMGHDDLKPQLRRKMKRAENLLVRKLSEKFSLAQIGGNPKMRA